jgi:hypothetical protein
MSLTPHSASHLPKVRKVYFFDRSGKDMLKKVDFCRYLDN